MRWKNLAYAGLVALAAAGLAACDGTENDRTQPTAPAGYVSPSLRGPESHGEATEGGEKHSEGEPAATAEAH